MSTYPANPTLTFPLTSGKAVDATKPSDQAASQTWLLTHQLAAGDEAAFREFHKQYFDRLYHFLLVVSHGQEQEAQDALQQTLLRVVRYIRPFDSEDIFWCWLKTVARSAARDANRKQRRYAAVLETFALRFLPTPSGNGIGEADLLTVALEESLVKYERGNFLIQHCRGVLSAAEQQIELLSKSAGDGSLQAKPLESGDEEA